MKIFFSIQPKMKAALLLAAICVAILANMFWERRNISNINDSFSSIYKDRLLPATYVFHLTDHLYQKRLILDNYFIHSAQPNIFADRHAIAKHNAAIDTLLEDFEATYLVEREDQLLHDFQQELQAFNALEKELLDNYEKIQRPDIAQATFKKHFETARTELTQLSQIQIDIGKKLEENSRRIAASTNVMTNMDALLIIVLGLIIQVLIFTSKSVTPKLPQQHELN